MATKKKTAVGQIDPAPSPAPATGSITLPEMPPAETFVGLVAYGVDTTANESRHIPLEFLGRGVQACIDATNASITQTAAAGTATEEAVTAKQGANEAAETARTEAANLSALKEAVAGATADAIEKTEAAETATGAANTATSQANAATADAIAKTNAAQTATDEANTAKDAAIEATENLTADVSALVPYIGENMIARSARCSGQWYWFSNDYSMPLMQPVKQGAKYTLSFDVVGVTGVGFSLILAHAYPVSPGVQYVAQINPEDVGLRKAVVFSAARTYAVGAILAGMGSDVAGGTIANIKLEVGSKATPYLPNPADIARAIDYSLLTEQVVPGEFWPDKNGKVKQVFCRTYIGTSPTAAVEFAWRLVWTGSTTSTTASKQTAVRVVGDIYYSNNGQSRGFDGGASPLTNTESTHSNYWGIVLFFTGSDVLYQNKRYRATIFYIYED